MSSSLIFQLCPSYLLCLIWMVFEMDGSWPYSCCFSGCCLQDPFNRARSILEQLPLSFFLDTLNFQRNGANGHISPFPVYYLLKLCVSNIARFNERKWLYFGKDKRNTIPCKTIRYAEYANDIAFLANTSAQSKSLLHSLERATNYIGLHVNADKIEFMCFN